MTKVVWVAKQGGYIRRQQPGTGINITSESLRPTMSTAHGSSTSLPLATTTDQNLGLPFDKLYSNLLTFLRCIPPQVTDHSLRFRGRENANTQRPEHTLNYPLSERGAWCCTGRRTGWVRIRCWRCRPLTWPGGESVCVIYTSYGT